MLHHSITTIQHQIYTVRGVKVMLDSDLAKLYDVKTKRLLEQLKRNPERFSEDFAFQLTKEEWENLRSQNATSSRHGGRRYLPYVFTEYGALMAASILKSPIAIEVNKSIIKAFIQLRNQAVKHQLKDSVTAIHHRIDALEANHLIDKTLLDSKMNTLSKEQLDVRATLASLSQLLDQFYDAHIVIKRPGEDSFNDQ